MNTPPVALTIAGSDSSAGAGIQVKRGSSVTITSSRLINNARAGLLDMAPANGTTLRDSLVSANGHDGRRYDGDGVELNGSGANFHTIGFLFSGGKFAHFRFPGSADTFPQDMNKNGVIVGTFGGGNGQGTDLCATLHACSAGSYPHAMWRGKKREVQCD